MADPGFVWPSTSLQDLESVLDQGFITGGNDIELSAGDALSSAGGTDVAITPAVGRDVAITDGAGLLLAGAARADGAAGRQNIVIGGGAAVDRGITFNTPLGNFGSIAWHSNGFLQDGELNYDGFSHRFRQQNVVNYRMSDVEFRTELAGLDLGATSTARRFDLGFVNNVTSKDGIQLGDGTNDRSTCHSVAGVPLPGLGVNGDFAFRDNGGIGTNLYVKKLGTWGAIA